MEQKTVNTESGNVLFLILIAVALFAALSYAVTSSTNSGGGDANDESALVNSAAITQYPASIKTAMIRMQVSNGVDPLEFKFDVPPFTSLTDTTTGVFHPDGGGATYSQSNPDVMVQGGAATNADGDWYFNYDFEVENISTTGASSAGNEIIAFLPDIKQSICSKINDELGITGIPVLSSGITVTTMMDEDSGYTVSTAAPAANMIGGTNLGAAELDGKPYGCFRNTGTGPYTYYHVLLER